MSLFVQKYFTFTNYYGPAHLERNTFWIYMEFFKGLLDTILVSVLKLPKMVMRCGWQCDGNEMWMTV